MMRVTVDADLCSGCGHCVAVCPEVFTHLGPDGVDLGISHVLEDGRVLAPGEAATVAAEHEAAVIAAACECPGEIIAVFRAGAYWASARGLLRHLTAFWNASACP